MGRINDVLILANRNYVPIDFIVLVIDCNPTLSVGTTPMESLGSLLRMAGAGLCKERVW